MSRKQDRYAQKARTQTQVNGQVIHRANQERLYMAKLAEEFSSEDPSWVHEPENFSPAERAYLKAKGLI
jgi:uncharacterized membrane protein